MKARPPTAAVGAHAGLDGSFRLLEFGEFHPVVYWRAQRPRYFWSAVKQLTAYRRIFHALAGAARDEGHSRDLITTVAQELSTDLEDGTMSTPDRNGVVWRTSSYTRVDVASARFRAT